MNVTQAVERVAISTAPIRTDEMLKEADRLVELAREVLDAANLKDVGIDEVALLCRGEAGQEANFIFGHVGKEGVQFFNRATDSVRTQPFCTNYEVRYYFLTTNRGYRLEVMRQTSGFSPLHHRYARPSVNGRVETTADARAMPFVHLSWKCSNTDEYFTHLDRLREARLLCGQACSSDYGKFSYWRSGTAYELGQTLVWLKPRVNLRDQTAPPSPQEGTATVPYREATSFRPDRMQTVEMEREEIPSRVIDMAELEEAMKKVRADWYEGAEMVLEGGTVRKAEER